MSVREEHRTALRALDGDPAAVRAYLAARSGLPGPRANLELLGAFADVAPADLVRALADDPDEYLRCCGTCGLGGLVVQAPADARAAPTDRLRARASDGSWRVREAVAMALQRIGDAEPGTLRALVSSWVADPDPLVRRAAVAGICEPRLLRNPATATAALDACAAATASIGALPPTHAATSTCVRCARPSGTAGASPSPVTRPQACCGSPRCAGRRTRTWRGSCARTRRRRACAVCSATRPDRATGAVAATAARRVAHRSCATSRRSICLIDVLIRDEGVR